MPYSKTHELMAPEGMLEKKIKLLQPTKTNLFSER
jgi:hypothetical protein